MSTGANTTPNTSSVAAAEPATAATQIPKPKRNPALAAMGVPSFTAKLPGPKWMTFWCLCAAGVGGWLYDKREQNKIREKYCKYVSDRLEASANNKDYPWYLKSRKISVFIAPPPDDYLETSMKTWRKFVKPVLYSAGLDYELFTTDTQGALRLQISREIRNIRRRILEHEKELEALQREKALKASYRYRWGQFWNNTVLRKQEAPKELDPVEEMIQAKKFKEEFDLKNLLGVFYDNKEMEKHKKSTTEDSLQQDFLLAGGVICLGRGAYKEYMAGVNEGLLGPLEMPEHVTEALEAKKQDWRDKQMKDKPDQLLDETKMPDYVPKSFIEKDKEYNYPPQELKDRIRDAETNIPYTFKQPVLCIPQPVVSGFLNLPRKIYRFYTKRYQVDEYCRAATSVVLQQVQPFKEEDLLVGKDSEEADWPKSWVKTGLEKNSEWVQPLTCDPRIMADLSTYNTDAAPHLYKQENN